MRETWRFSIFLKKHIPSRYLLREYDKDIAERILKVFLEKTMNFLFPLRFKTKKSR